MALKNTNERSESSIANSINALIDSAVSFIENLFKTKARTLDEFAKSSSAEIDKIILKKMSEGNEFIAGRFKIFFVDDAAFKFSFEVYLNSPKEKDYIHLTGTSKAISMSCLQESAQAELKAETEISYEIEEPDANTFKKVADDAQSETQSASSVSLSEKMNSARREN